jgi:hypothetical protein
MEIAMKRAKSKQKAHGIEFMPDAWARFERAVDVVAKSPPQHRKPKRKSRKRRAK